MFSIRAQAEQRRPAIWVPLFWASLALLTFAILEPDERNGPEVIWVFVPLVIAALESFVYLRLRSRGEAAYMRWLPVARWASLAAAAFILLPLLVALGMKAVGIETQGCFECTSEDTGPNMVGWFLLGLVGASCAVAIGAFGWIAHLVESLIRLGRGPRVDPGDSQPSAGAADADL